MSHFSRPGRHENGQNFLHDERSINRLIAKVADTPGSILEIGGGAGALSGRLAELGRQLTVIEVDSRLAARLRTTLADRGEVVQADYLKYRLPAGTDVVVGNLPFHLTTAIMRKLLDEPGWQHAVLIAQWEVARRRVAVGGASMLTAQVWPWFRFELLIKVPAQAFRPKPAVDGGMFSISRREHPLVPSDAASRRSYRAFVQRVFTGPGRGISQILTRILPPRRVGPLLRELGISPAALPKDLRAGQWAALWRCYRR